MRAAAGALLALRLAYGVALILAPARLARRWLGPVVDGAPAKVLLRGVGARELAVHGGALGALFAGRSLRPWLLASIAGDLGDITATLLARAELPDGAAPAATLVAGSSALLTAALVGAEAKR